MQLTTDQLVSTLAECESTIHARFRRRLAFVNQRMDTDDLFQITCMRALKSFATCKASNEDELKHWVLTIARNSCETEVTRHLGTDSRSLRREQCAIGVGTGEDSTGFNPSYESEPDVGMILAEEFGSAISRLDRIPKIQQRALEMRYLDQEDYTEIAEELACTENAARLLVSRGAAAVRGQKDQPCLPGFEEQYAGLAN